MSKKQFFVSLVLAKLLFSFISWYVIGGMTQLGDTQSYLSGMFLYRNDWSSTAFIMSYFGKMFSNIVGYNVIANFPLLFIGLAGIWLGVKKIEMPAPYWLMFLLVMCMPSTLMWTSIHSKEAVLNALLGVLAYLLIHKISGEDWSVKHKVVLAVTYLMIAFFKPLYVPAISWFLLYAMTYQIKVKKVFITLTLSVLGIGLFALVIHLFYDQLSTYLQLFHRNFTTKGELTRIGNVWQSVDEFLLSALSGMFISFIGPTFMEAVKVITMLPFFVEGLATVFIIFYLILRASVKQSELYVHTFFMLFGGVILFLLAQYPVGFFNPGSAIRYKQSFLPFLFTILFYLAYDIRVRQVNVS